LHALDHASRLAETASGEIDFWTVRGRPDDVGAGRLCADAMRSAVSIAGEVAAPSDSAQSSRLMPAVASGAAAVSTEKALAQLERCATELGKLKRNHRNATLGAVANGTLTADAAIVRVDTLRSLGRWRITPGAPQCILSVALNSITFQLPARSQTSSARRMSG